MVKKSVLRTERHFSSLRVNHEQVLSRINVYYEALISLPPSPSLFPSIRPCPSLALFHPSHVIPHERIF